MRHVELDYYLTTMLRMSSGSVVGGASEVSDFNLTVNRPLQVEQGGELKAVACTPPITRLTPYQTEMFALNLLNGNPRLIRELLGSGSCDTAYSLGGNTRFRVNVFSQRGHFSVVLRKLSSKIPSFDQLGLPPILREAAGEINGLVLVTGATGVGKSTTLAAMLNEINETKSVHVITLEDPVEFVHTHKKSTFNQREMGCDFSAFSTGLRAALRQSPKVILVGEMRDRETVEVALSAAETGHLVLSTLHTIDAGVTINRILSMFNVEEQPQVRQRLADTLRWIVSQRLAPRIGGGRYAIMEIMGSNLRTREAIVQGESEGKTFYEITEASSPFGWRTFDQSALAAYELNIIDEDTALQYCSRRGVVSRGVDRLKQMRGQRTVRTELRMRTEAGPSPELPPPFKMK
jgi:twitching motility protein PilT